MFYIYILAKKRYIFSPVQYKGQNKVVYRNIRYSWQVWPCYRSGRFDPTAWGRLPGFALAAQLRPA